MNNVVVSGYVQDEPKIYTGGQTPVASFTLTIGRGKGKNGESLGYDYPRVKAFGSSAEYVSQKVGKGDYVTVMGKIATGSYDDKNGNKVYTTEVNASRIEAANVLAHNAEQRGGYNSNGSYSSYNSFNNVWGD